MCDSENVTKLRFENAVVSNHVSNLKERISTLESNVVALNALTLKMGEIINKMYDLLPTSKMGAVLTSQVRSVLFPNEERLANYE